MKIICVDVGNTLINVAIMDEYKKIDSFSIPTIKDAKVDFFVRELKSALKEKHDAIISSVCPEVNDNLVNAFARLNINARVVNPMQLEHLMKIGINPKKEIGTDLFVSNLYASLDGDVIVVDMGTATTIMATQNNTFVGGAILPGVKSSYKALSDNTSLLNDVSFESVDTPIGKSTKGALLSGMLYGTIGQIKNIIEEIKKETKIKRVVFTGGMSRYFYKYFKGATNDEDLILKGLVKIYKYLGGE